MYLICISENFNQKFFRRSMRSKLPRKVRRLQSWWALRRYHAHIALYFLSLSRLSLSQNPPSAPDFVLHGNVCIFCSRNTRTSLSLHWCLLFFVFCFFFSDNDGRQNEWNEVKAIFSQQWKKVQYRNYFCFVLFFVFFLLPRGLNVLLESTISLI